MTDGQSDERIDGLMDRQTDLQTTREAGKQVIIQTGTQRVRHPSIQSDK